MTITTPDTPTRAQEEILITLRALAGLVAEALWCTAASGDEAAAAWEGARLAFWRDFQLHHTRRLLPAVVGDVDEAACRAFAAQLVHALYLEDHDSDSEASHRVADRAV